MSGLIRKSLDSPEETRPFEDEMGIRTRQRHVRRGGEGDLPARLAVPNTSNR